MICQPSSWACSARWLLQNKSRPRKATLHHLQLCCLTYCQVSQNISSCKYRGILEVLTKYLQAKQEGIQFSQESVESTPETQRGSKSHLHPHRRTGSKAVDLGPWWTKAEKRNWGSWPHGKTNDKWFKNPGIMMSAYDFRCSPPFFFLSLVEYLRLLSPLIFASELQCSPTSANICAPSSWEVLDDGSASRQWTRCR